LNSVCFLSKLLKRKTAIGTPGEASLKEVHTFPRPSCKGTGWGKKIQKSREKKKITGSGYGGDKKEPEAFRSPEFCRKMGRKTPKKKNRQSKGTWSKKTDPTEKGELPRPKILKRMNPFAAKKGGSKKGEKKEKKTQNKLGKESLSQRKRMGNEP